MTPPTDALLSVAEAAARIGESLAELPVEVVPLAHAHGRVLRAAVRAERDQPPFDRATMDGVALASSDASVTLAVSGEGAAGRPAARYGGAGSSIEIMTGAPMPAGTDCVIPVEDLQREGDVVRPAAAARREPGRFVHARGSDHERGTLLLEPGIVLGAAEVAVLASAGMATVPVTRPARVCLIATGDELVEADAPVADHQIRRSNDYAGAALIERHGLGRVQRRHVPDDIERLRALVGRELEACDALILCGGVSKGRYDFVAEALAACGVRKRFHGVAQRPGKPLWFGLGPAGRPVFALPGNPVSSLVCLRRYVIDALAAMSGQRREQNGEFAVLSDMVAFQPALTWFAPARCHDDGGGRRVAVLRPTNTSGDLTALAGTHGFVELDAAVTRFAAGHAARWYPW